MLLHSTELNTVNVLTFQTTESYIQISVAIYIYIQIGEA